MKDEAIRLIYPEVVNVIIRGNEILAIDKNNIQINIDISLIDKKVKELEIQKHINDTKASLINLCDLKQDNIKTLILGYKNTQKQQERYDNKYQRSLRVRADIEANTTSTETNQEILNNYQTIIAKYEYVKSQIEKFIDLIEDFRTKVDDMIELGELDKANELIALAQNFDAQTSQADIDKLFL